MSAAGRSWADAVGVDRAIIAIARTAAVSLIETEADIFLIWENLVNDRRREPHWRNGSELHAGPKNREIP